MDISAVGVALKNPVLSAATSAVVGGVCELVPVGRARGLTRAAIVVLPAAFATAAVAVRRVGAVPHRSSSPLATVVAPSAAGGVVASAQWAALALDRGVESFLVRRRVRRPRVVMAAVSAVVTSLLVMLERSGTSRSAPAHPDGGAQLRGS